jgi:hypothetical protein
MMMTVLVHVLPLVGPHNSLEQRMCHPATVMTCARIELRNARDWPAGFADKPELTGEFASDRSGQKQKKITSALIRSSQLAS